jgi:Flp pilus assembly protein TadD
VRAPSFALLPGALLLLLLAGSARAQEPDPQDPGPAAHSPYEDLGLRWYEEAWIARERGDFEAATEALRRAEEHGADPQLIALEMGYLHKEGRDLGLAQEHFVTARDGASPAISTVAGASMVQLALLEQADTMGFGRSELIFWLEEADRAQRMHLWDLARQALQRAREAGADPQLIALELAYLERSAGDHAISYAQFEQAAEGGEERWVALARREMDKDEPFDLSSGSWEVLLQQAWLAKRRGEHARAKEAFEAAEAAGADPQRVALELAYLASSRHDRATAREMLQRAAEGPDEALAQQARRELAVMGPRKGQLAASDPKSQPWYWFDLAWKARDQGELEQARRALYTARDLGAPSQRVALELGYLDLAAGDPDAARLRLEEAVRGEDPELAQQATAQLEVLDSPSEESLGPGMPGYWMRQAWTAKEAGELAEAREAFFYARELGAPSQQVAIELGYLAMVEGDRELALLYFEEASLGADPGLAQLGAAELEAARPQAPGASAFDPSHPGYWLEQGWALKEEREFEDARRAFMTARELGADSQVVALELGYNALERGDRTEAFHAFREAAEGPDPARSAQAEAELEHLDGPFWGEVYGDVYGWWRLTPSRSLYGVPTVRARYYWTPWGTLDLHAYLFTQISRDMSSSPGSISGYPITYADNTLLFGAGGLARFFGRQAGIYAQLGPALRLVDDGEKRWWFDARVAAYVGLEGGPARPGALAKGERAHGPPGLWREVYAEAVYATRFDHNVIAMARGRAGFTPLITSSVAWQPMLQARAFGDLHGDYWNNRADIGPAHRWRWQRELPVDLLLGFNVGSYYGRENEDLAPRPLLFTELWLQVVTLYQF